MINLQFTVIFLNVNVEKFNLYNIKIKKIKCQK